MHFPKDPGILIRGNGVTTAETYRYHGHIDDEGGATPLVPPTQGRKIARITSGKHGTIQSKRLDSKKPRVYWVAYDTCLAMHQIRNLGVIQYVSAPKA